MYTGQQRVTAETLECKKLFHHEPRMGHIMGHMAADPRRAAPA